jgi:uncharacterized protein YajQ (UPF0234 family)
MINKIHFKEYNNKVENYHKDVNTSYDFVAAKANK